MADASSAFTSGRWVGENTLDVSCVVNGGDYDMPSELLLIGGGIGLLLVIVGWFGRRIDRHPRCRSCRYDLSGTEIAPTCPECGNDLERRRGIRVGRRKRHPIVVVLGLLLISCTAGGGVARLGHIDWYEYKPVWWLKNDLRAADTRSHRALWHRIRDGKMSQTDIETTVALAMKKHMNPDYPWTAELGELVEVAHDLGATTDLDHGLFLRQAFELAFVPTVIDPQSSQGTATLKLDMTRPRLSRRRIPFDPDRRLMALLVPKSPLIASISPLEIPMVWEVCIYEGSVDEPTYASANEVPAPITRWTMTKPAAVEVPYDNRWGRRR
jgi:hypothetical protein